MKFNLREFICEKSFFFGYWLNEILWNFYEMEKRLLIISNIFYLSFLFDGLSLIIKSN